MFKRTHIHILNFSHGLYHFNHAGGNWVDIDPIIINDNKN